MSTSGAAAGGSSLPDPVTVAHGGTGAATAVAGFDALSPLTTRGDVLTRDATDSVRLARAAPGQGYVGDGVDTVAGYAQHGQAWRASLPTNAIAQTYPRSLVSGANLSQTRGTLYVVACGFAKGVVISSISWISGSTHTLTPTNQIFGIYDASKNRLAVTNDDGATAWGASTVKTLLIAGGGTYTITATAMYYLAYMVAGSAGSPQTFATTGNATIVGLAPILSGVTNDTGLTTTLPNPFGTITAAGTVAWAYAS